MTVAAVAAGSGVTAAVRAELSGIMLAGRHSQGVRRSRVDSRNGPGTGMPIRS
jgi:hypothetical protein